MEEVCIEVDATRAGLRLDRLLAQIAGSRSQAEALIATGRVLVDGRRRPKSHPVCAGERISIAPAPARDGEPADAAVPFSIVFEDEHLLIVDKPAGLVVHPARGHWTGTLVQALGGRVSGGDDPARAGIVHRLDRDTSGLLVVAKSEEAHRLLKRQLAARCLHREYVALVDGLPDARSGTIDAPIGRDRRNRLAMSIDSDSPREARTHFVLERALARTALLKVVLDTGRTHQIRVHMAAIGHPLVGDLRYGGPQRYGLRRQFLHARRLCLTHPLGGQQIDVSSPLPDDLARALAAAQRE
jgi:23S rRNA pseudouridine1911/1915/1917 synthase